MGSFIMDGNFSAQHMKMKRPEDDVRLADGHGFMVTDQPYKDHLRTAAKPRKQVTAIDSPIIFPPSNRRSQKLECHEHRAVTGAGGERGNLEATGIGASACSRHGCFVPHACVDYQKGEQ